ncbi:MAG: hypothetical protein ABL921_20365 [Pirellula sp.]
MTLNDSKLIELLLHESVAVRTVALDLLNESYSTDHRWLPQVFLAWDRFGPDKAFPEFPLLTHLAIPQDLVDECLSRAEQMASGRALIDRVCRCAGKLIEAVSTAPPETFANQLDSIRSLKKTSKIFFRVSDAALQARCEWMDRSVADLLFHLKNEPSRLGNLFHVFESQFLQGRYFELIKGLLMSLEQGNADPAETAAAIHCLELATRHRMIGFEHSLIGLIDHTEPAIADAAAIGLARCRTDTSLSLIAERFTDFSQKAQFRAIDVLRRGRIPKTSMLLRFLQGNRSIHGNIVSQRVQNALRMAEVLQFDFSDLEDWLEALLTVDDEPLLQFQGHLSIVTPLCESMETDEKNRVMQLVQSRLRQ